MSNVVNQETKNRANGKPMMLAPIYANIPQEMQGCRRWINWKLSKNPKPSGKPWTKIPLDPKTGRKAATTRDTTWTNFDFACQQHEQYAAQEGKGQSQGLGFILRGNHVGIDLDNCRDPQTGELEPWARDIIIRINSYTEISPSGTGIRIICRGKLPPGARRKGTVEMYDESSPRYLTITGHVLDGLGDIYDRQAEIEAVHAEYLGTETTEETKPTPAYDPPEDLDSDEVLEKAMTAKNGERFSKLWRGEWAGNYTSQSEADLALAGDLAFWCGPNPETIDAMFRQSGLYRSKWERADYREGTIAKAMERDKFYDWGVDGTKIDDIIKPAELPIAKSDQQPAKPARVVLEKWSQTKAIARQQQEDWLIKGWAEFGCLHAVTGLPFSGKSSIIADILAAMVRGEPWCDMTVKAVPFVLLDLENKERILVKRLERALEGNEGRMEELYNRVNPGDLPEVPIPIKFVVECIEAVGAPKGFIIIDTMRTAFQKDSNDETAMLSLLTPLKLIAHRTGWCIIVLHHNAKGSNRYSGNTAFAGVLDYLWNWTRDGYVAELSLEGRDDAVQPLCFEFDLDEQRNIFQGTKGETAAADRQERSSLDLYQVLRHLPDSPNGLTVAEVMALSGVKKWRCRDLLTKKAVNAKYAVKVGVGSIGSPSTYYRTQAGKALVDKYAGKSLLG